MADTISFRPTDEDLDRLNRLREAIPDALGKPLSPTVILRLGLMALEAERLKPEKKPRKKS